MMPDDAGGLLAVHAHPDDETLWTGGLLATWAAAGRRVTVVTCTRGERGEVIALPGTTSAGLAHLEGDGPALGAYRERELAAAAAALGVDQVFLDEIPRGPAQDGPAGRVGSLAPDGLSRYEDSGMRWVRPGVAGPAEDSPASAFARVELDEPAGRLAGLLRELRPAVVVTYEPSGGYGHPDHIRAHDVTVRALRLLEESRGPASAGTGVAGAARPGPPELWQAVVPARELRAARRELARLDEARAVVVGHGLTLPDPDEALPPYAREDLPGPSGGAAGGDRLERVEVAPVLDRVLAAMRAHATQVQHVTRAPAPGMLGYYALSNGVLAPLPRHETYLVSAPAGRPGRPPSR
ncbi:PIG-L family deacetylase [Myceligenerans crystallogenes]|uniref:N-acetyl-1-D-myo-inositol-2-amino-2-deoxy-alpha-D-glucopyranoside deacetylase n=1 Tax=Myceligenerans crystallogenes TaxID=316335 RepID=A0ABN2NMK1_9MICO